MDKDSKILAQSLNNGAPITTQVGAYNTYVGARYVPKFATPAQWNPNTAYEPLTIVINQGNSYTSAQFVPPGVPLQDEGPYWFITGNFNSQVEAYRQEVENLRTSISDLLLSQNYVTPEQFGAKGDGITNDSSAFQAAINESSNSLKGVYLASPQYYLGDTINVNHNKLIIFSNPYTELGTTITCGNIPVIFNITSPRCSFYGFNVMHDITNSQVSPATVFNFTPGEPYDCDGEISYCSITGFEIGINIQGKNLNINNCLISHCNTGISCTVPPGAEDAPYRGLYIINNRFHNCGAEDNYSETTSCIYYNQQNSNIIHQFFITGNYADLGTTFFRGGGQGGWISNNYLTSLHGNGIDMNYPSNTTFKDNAIPNICNNFISCRASGTANIGIKITGGYRSAIINNYFQSFKVNSILIENSARSHILNNTIDGNSSDYQIKVINSSNCLISGNNEIYSPTTTSLSVACLNTTGNASSCNYYAGLHYGSVKLSPILNTYYETDNTGCNAQVNLMGGICTIVFGGNAAKPHTNIETDAIITLPIKPPNNLEFLDTLSQKRFYISTTGQVYGTIAVNEPLRGSITFPYI